jgi:hypothetical protein
VPKTVQIRDIADDVYAALVRHAAQAGITVPDLLRREATRLAARPTMEEWLARTRRRPSGITRAEVIEAFDELRGPWPDADR